MHRGTSKIFESNPLGGGGAVLTVIRTWSGSCRLSVYWRIFAPFGIWSGPKFSLDCGFDDAVAYECICVNLRLIMCYIRYWGS